MSDGQGKALIELGSDKKDYDKERAKMLDLLLLWSVDARRGLIFHGVVGDSRGSGLGWRLVP